MESRKRCCNEQKCVSDLFSARSAIRKRDIDFVSNALHNGGLDVHYLPPGQTWTLIHTAASLGTPELLRLLIRHGAGVNTRDKIYGFGPLTVATLEQKVENVACLLELHANPNEIDWRGHKPMCTARESHGDNFEKIRALLEPVSSPCETCEKNTLCKE